MLPRHPKAKQLLESGLFNNLTCFAELEARIQAMATSEEQQEAFALFAEGVLTARTLHRAVEIWPTGQIPPDVRKRLALPENIPGADGLFRSLEGEIHAYQLLFRPNREKPTPNETNQFPALVAQTLQPLFFTNCDLLPNNWKKLKNFHCIRGMDLDRLEPRMFQTLRRWLQGAGAAIERSMTPPFHTNALEKIQTLLTSNEQATLIVPPGGEARLLTLRTIQRLGGRRVILVMLSSLNNLIQTIRIWRTHAGWGDMAILQVAEEPNNSTLNELEFPLTQHQDGVRRFLTWHHTGMRIILATQGAAPLLARAMMGFPQPDLLITVGALPTPPLQTTKTLNIYPSQNRPHPVTMEGASKTLPLARPWQLLLLPVWINNKASENPEAMITTALTWIKQQESIRHLHLHLPESTPRALLANEADENDPFTLFQISSEQVKKLSERDRLLNAFMRAKRAILLQSLPIIPGSWVLPADLVVFFTSPATKHLTKALTPILTPGATAGTGSILLPIFLKEENLADNELLWEILNGLLSIDDAFVTLLNTTMEQLGRDGHYDSKPILKQLKLIPVNDKEESQKLEQAVVAAVLKQLGSSWYQHFGELQHYCQQQGDGAIPNDWPENPPLATWAIQQRKAKAQQNLSPTQENLLTNAGFVWDLEAFAWDNACKQVARIIALHGHPKQFATTPIPYPHDPELETWATKQRDLKKKEKLEPERITQLNEIGFVWDLAEAAWEEAFQLVITFKRTKGDGKIPSHFPENPALGKWAEKQRKEYKQNKLLPERQTRLDVEGFVWDLAVAAWEEMLEVLRQHRLQYGHGKVPKEWPANPTLAIWAEEQRRLRLKETLPPDRITRLDAVDFVWDLKKARWEEGFAAFQHFFQQHQHGKVPDPYLESLLLDQWAREMRRGYRLEKLSPQQITRLEEAGFVWDLEAAAWKEAYEELSRFRATHGHVDVADPYPDAPTLPAWIQLQRRANNKGVLTPEQVQRLDALEFIWDPVEKHWQDQFKALTDFYQTQGHFNVPKEWSDQPDLFQWVKSQRLARDKEKLDESKLALLTELGFVWNPQEAAWEEMFLALSQFQQVRTHCLVPAQWPNNPSLARWVDQQRRDYRLKQLPDDKIARMEALGFIWDSKAIFWEEMFAALTEYREQQGNCLVPDNDPALSQLAWWVAAQRKARQSEQLEPERLLRLDAIGFIWDAQEVIWQESLRLLTEFRQRFGHCIVPADWPENPRLSTWITAQRNAKIKGHLGSKREEILTQLGIIWDPKEAVAEEMLMQLAAFMATYGHCDVPLDNQEYPRLGMWVQFQRQSYKDSTLEPTRQQRLEEIGIEWK